MMSVGKEVLEGDPVGLSVFLPPLELRVPGDYGIVGMTPAGRPDPLLVVENNFVFAPTEE